MSLSSYVTHANLSSWKAKEAAEQICQVEWKREDAS